jgi:osmoprotectant transport system permease protein
MVMLASGASEQQAAATFYRIHPTLLVFANGFLAQHGSEIVTLTIEHLWLTGAAVLFATAIGVPLGVLLTRRPRIAMPVLTVANIIQTIPSLALFGFLLPVPWLGDRAARIAIVALTGYALLPILRNTYIGIRSIDPAVIDVAHALGMTGSQRLFKVELPLAAGVILAGLRTATVTCVGIATIAAAVGAGGLGEFIFRGVASVDNRLVLAGAIPAALLALVADTLLGLAERYASGAPKNSSS